MSTKAGTVQLYDCTLTSFGEGMDRYAKRAYLWRDEAIFLFRHGEATPDAEPLMARITAEELSAIAAAAIAAHESYHSAGVTRD